MEAKQSFCSKDCTYAQCHTIVELGKEDSISLVDLATKLNVDKSAMSRTVDELVKKGFVCRKPNPSDRRYIKIALTSQGQQILVDIDQNSRHFFDRLLNSIQQDKQLEMISGLLLFAQAIKQYMHDSNKSD